MHSGTRGDTTTEINPIVATLEQAAKRYGRVTAVDGIDLEVRRGEVVAMLGRVIILTTFARPGYLRRALETGVRGYVNGSVPKTDRRSTRPAGPIRSPWQFISGQDPREEWTGLFD